MEVGYAIYKNMTDLVLHELLYLSEMRAGEDLLWDGQSHSLAKVYYRACALYHSLKSKKGAKVY